MNVGKIQESVLRRSVFRQLKTKREEVLCGAGPGEDCAILSFPPGEELLVSSAALGENRARCGPVRNPYRCEQSGSVRGKACRRLADRSPSAGSGGRGTESAHEAGGAGLCRIEYPDCGRSYGGHFGGEPDSIFRYSGGQRPLRAGDTNGRASSGGGAGGDEVGRTGGNDSGCEGKGTGAFVPFSGVSGGGGEGI